MSNKKRKTATAVVATAVTAAVLLTGTYAWQSISQTATNIASDTVNPGGRLHDDFSGPGKNKDIYVENFADEQIFARIQLSEYFEIGQEAGANFGVDSRNVSIITTDEEGNASNPEDKSTWSIHKFDDTDNTADYWTWATGGSTIFMPTFNKNKDSLEADINGTYESIDGEGNRYSDYVEYEDGETVTENAIYDSDTNDTDEIAEENAQIDINYKEVSEEHIATATATAELKSMQEWIDEGKPVGDYWVYDTDGWVYYAKPIEAGEATGLLLDGIELTGVVDHNWYYAINVEAQFVTANDLGKGEATGFYDLTRGTAPSEDALTLLEKIGVNVPRVFDVAINVNDEYTMDSTNDISVTVTKDGTEVNVAAEDIEYSLTQGDATVATMSLDATGVYEKEDGTASLVINSEDLITDKLTLTVTYTDPNTSKQYMSTKVITVSDYVLDTTAPNVVLEDVTMNEDNHTMIKAIISDVNSADYPITVEYYIAETVDSEEATGPHYTATLQDGETETTYNYSDLQPMDYIGKYARVVVTDVSGNSKVVTDNEMLTLSGCFEAGTKVLTETGLKNIEDIQVGEMVYSVNMDTNEKELEEVTKVHNYGTSKEIYNIYAGDETIKSSPEHLFYVIDKGWVEAQSLEEGDVLSSLNGENVSIEKIEKNTLEEPIIVYNLTVNKNHNFLITDNEILVHNISK